MNKLEGLDIVCLSTSAWDYPFGSKQNIMNRLSKENRILYIESQLSILHVFKYPLLFFSRAKDFLKGLWHPYAANKNIIVFSPPPIFLPFDTYSLHINAFNQKILLLLLKCVFKRIGFRPVILWAFHPRSAQLCGRLNERLSIYHGIDEYSVEKTSKSRKNVLEILESEILAKVDIVFLCSKELCKLKSKLRPDAIFLPPGGDFARFAHNAHKYAIPADIKEIRPPRIGFAGSLDRRIDAGLISAVAQRNPHWSIILIGNNRLSTEENKLLSKSSNIYFLGFKNRNDIPAYIHALDICILPYFIDEFTKFIFPLKLFECLASGKPIVSTALADLEAYSNYIHVCRTYNAFIQAIQASLTNVQDGQAERTMLAEENSWDIRVKEAAGIIIQKLSKSNV
ncbi:MAG: hypothetical protein A2Y00_03210 [Omnitrophica WOR_2 bacterium GWF2_43_52]|nr:MAG: hypothetical protein A2Y00_03210 [Omnitrophica WOR_2 bacterium GWF2_43_52]OGX54759.1 MAG: hypothetical protein A2460_07765 [Omnitrophica WOR_2 bacterium RIFOXYC2_FULL_43_9]HAH20862.1 hypothetical protein [Candidatus Omnitrophota bacterium]HBG64530.1 hypothetical protein [Candidatus Omnitrophota bacterium]